MSSKFYLEPIEPSVFTFSLEHNVSGVFKSFTNFINDTANKYIFNKNFLSCLNYSFEWCLIYELGE